MSGVASPTRAPGPGPWHVASRVLGAVLGGYALSAALVALLSVALPLVSGLARSEAVILASMLGFLIYLGLLLWAFAERRLARVWVVTVGGAGLAYALVRLIGSLGHTP
jgi:hypothetical protein